MDKGLQLSKTALSLRNGASTLTVTPIPDEATIPSVTWRSTDPSVATVTGDGYTATVTPVKTGETQIIVTSSDGKYSATCDVKPMNISSVSFKIRDQEYTGYAIQLKATDITTTLKYGEDYIVLYYENNVKKGTAKVTLIGVNNWGGTKTVSFKIVQRNMAKHWADSAVRIAQALFGE